MQILKKPDIRTVKCTISVHSSAQTLFKVYQFFIQFMKGTLSSSSKTKNIKTSWLEDVLKQNVWTLQCLSDYDYKQIVVEKMSFVSWGEVKLFGVSYQKGRDCGNLQYCYSALLGPFLVRLRVLIKMAPAMSVEQNKPSI